MNSNFARILVLFCHKVSGDGMKLTSKVFMWRTAPSRNSGNVPTFIPNTLQYGRPLSFRLPVVSHEVAAKLRQRRAKRGAVSGLV
tara:strand:- start:57 stop:311 length:255 start_codon:yes stop_codon:yes gene_type:complete